MPAVNAFFGMAAISIIWWTPFLVFAAFAVAYTEGYKALNRWRPGPGTCWARWLVW